MSDVPFSDPDALLERVEFTADAQIQLRACWSGYGGLAQIWADKTERQVVAPVGDYKLAYTGQGSAEMREFRKKPVTPSTQPSK